MKQYLITGGAGFIGANFIRYLYQQEKGAKVRVLDKLTYSGNMDNLAEFQGKEGFEFIQGDISDDRVVKATMKDVQVVVNFAAEVAVDRSIQDQQSFLKTDVLGVHVLLENALAQKEHLERFVQISTDEVYGQILEGSFRETSELKPRNPYSASKTGGDRLAYSYFATYQLPVIITRASNTYGPWAYPEKVIPLFITNILEGLQVPVFGEGSQIRDWLYVEDHCSAIYHLIQKGQNGEVYNVGSHQEYTNLSLTKMILDLMSRDESSIRFVADRPGHDFRYSLDTAKLQGTGWSPKYDLPTGLKKTVDWYQNHEDYWQKLKAKLDPRFAQGYWGEKEKSEVS
ncbi:dTDP-glucose 4,6-dehydratase [Dehalobacterium formicoaceticum]|uniref:dTDP-glucose 4,6-dehydratase n=1 Tax=Dehalobacterium formicoaceticum TaxID=51515 RepID=A0ABT1XZY1_9FIRM|nr:dTDP-glucose 4,6-dehydratase [Dehalobacterium formicoaceticum]MCR6544170.1 dTDP-glucose 4,6-dehydratase [Dehalobacterium formicoaceticum]